MRIHKEGHIIILVNFLVCASIALCFWLFCNSETTNWIISAIAFSLTLFMFSFFRVPKRDSVVDGNLVISPGDGKIINIKEVYENEFFKEKCIRVSIFLSFFNIHITWFPVGGKVIYYKYHPGKYIIACHHKSSEKNERTTIAIRTESGKVVMFRQIAGVVARRVVCYAKEETDFQQSSEAGFIKFGSRLDIFLPLGTELLVKKGDKVRGQISGIAKLN